MRGPCPLLTPSLRLLPAQGQTQEPHLVKHPEVQLQLAVVRLPTKSDSCAARGTRLLPSPFQGKVI